MPLLEIEVQRVNKALYKLMAHKAADLVLTDSHIISVTRGNKVTISEERPMFRNPDKLVQMKIAQLEYSPTTKKWSLFCYDRNSKRRPYFDAGDKSLDSLIQIVIDDPTGIFWG